MPSRPASETQRAASVSKPRAMIINEGHLSQLKIKPNPSSADQTHILEFVRQTFCVWSRLFRPHLKYFRAFLKL